MTSRKTARFAASALLFAVFTCGRGIAQFEERASLSISTAPLAMAVGDFNRDGKLDIAVSSYIPTNGVTILLGNGDGTFRLGESYAAGVQLSFLAAADFRRKGILDLVVGDTLTNDIYVMLGNGDGTFQPAVAYPAIGESVTVATGDFTGDGKLDIIAITSSTQCDCISVFPGNGDGTFQAAINTPVPYNVAGFALAVGYFNEDGRLDVAVAGAFGSANQVDILLGNGDGTFSPHGYYQVLSGPSALVVADFNGDHQADLAVDSLTGDSIGVLLGNGDGTFQQAVNYYAQFPASLAARDLDGNGKLDIVAANSGELGIPAGVTVLKGNGDGTFQPGVFYEAGREEGGYVVVGDFNGDGKPDIALTDYVDDLIITLLNTGTVTFSPTTPLTFPTQLIGTTSAPLTATLTNNGTSSLTISSVSFSGKPFKVRSTCVGSVAPGGNCTITAVFTAQVEGVTSGTVTIKDSASSKPQVVELVGTGTVVELTPPKLNFPPQKVGTKSATQNVQLTNTGSTALDFTYFLYIDGTNYKDFSQTNTCASSLNPGASCTITVTFAPKKTGTRSAFVTITDTGGGSPQTVLLTGTGD